MFRKEITFAYCYIIYCLPSKNISLQRKICDLCANRFANKNLYISFYFIFIAVQRVKCLSLQLDGKEF